MWDSLFVPVEDMPGSDCVRGILMYQQSTCIRKSGIRTTADLRLDWIDNWEADPTTMSKKKELSGYSDCQRLCFDWDVVVYYSSPITVSVEKTRRTTYRSTEIIMVPMWLTKPEGS